MDDKYEIYDVSAEMWKCDEKYFPNLLVLRLQWNANIGWGQIDFSYDAQTKEWRVDDECMSEAFCRAVLNKWLHEIYNAESSQDSVLDEHVYCTQCKNFIFDGEDIDCPYSEECYLFDPEDSAPKYKRRCYSPMKD